jgi:tetratricopeptide (TPR) repeat protein
MNETYINEQHQKIITLLNQKRLKEAFALLDRFLSDGILWDLYSQLEYIQCSYNCMLEYMRLDVPDPDRKKLYRRFLCETMEVADQIRVEKMSLSSAYLYYSTKNNLTHPPTIKHALTELENYTENLAVANLYNSADGKNLNEIRLRHEEAYHTLFLLVWTNSLWDLQEENEANELLHSLLIPLNDVCLFVSAVTLSLMECFDLRKFLYLFDAYNHNAVEINQRALIGIALITHLYAERLSLYPEISARLAYLNENESFGKELNRLYIQLLLCRETEKIEKRMREEIIPEMMKNVKNLRFKFDFEEPDEEKDDHNPDWKDISEQTGLEERIREISELQMEGADVHMATFSTLKTYPFFNNISNWFYPFDKQHSEVVKEIAAQKNHVIIDLILQTAFFCDSDKYSICFTMANIPPGQQEAMTDQLSEGQDMDIFNKKRDALIPEERAKLPESISSQYLHNLYRFFKLYPRRHEFRNILGESIELHKYSILANVLNKPEFLLKIGDYYFRKDYFTKAIEIYADIIIQTGGNAELFQKTGYCEQKKKEYARAIDAYLKADILQSDNLWTNRRLATCYRMTKSYEKALKYYLKVEMLQHDDPNLTFYIGSCYAGLERYNEALNYFYKFELSDSDPVKAWRAIGWCSFVTGKYEPAEKYYNKLLEKKPALLDFLNAGHVAWSMGQTKKAIELYSKAIEQCEDKKEFLEWFIKDKPMLIKQGIDEGETGLMLDLLLFFLSEC